MTHFTVGELRGMVAQGNEAALTELMRRASVTSELLAALRSMVLEAEGTGEQPIHPEMARRIAVARALIARAEGH